MTVESEPRHFRSLLDLDARELLELLEQGQELAEGKGGGEWSLAGRTLALIFEKSSTRTRVSFEVGIHQLGGNAIFLSPRDTQMGRGEPLEDTARVLSGYVDGIMIRTFGQEIVEELARHGSVPVINGLTDRFHPCQLLADLLTVRQAFGPELLEDTPDQLRVAWLGDGNNMAHSWLNAAALLGFELRLAVPRGYDPDPQIVASAEGSGRILLTRDPAEAVAGAHVVTTDVWASMGQEEEAREREAAFEEFQVKEELMARAHSDSIFLHCLPAHRGEEVTAQVMDGPRSRVFQQAENRLHAQKALLSFLFQTD